MSRHPEIIDFLRAEGLTVIETNGWRTRGSETFDPHGSVNHHTAAGAGLAPSLGICINGRSDLPGPLCNVLQSRQVDGEGLDVVYLVAAGRANHAGSGGWKGLAGNSKVWGLEVEHRGTVAEPFSIKRMETAIRVHVAFAKCSRFDASTVCQHREWAPTRKIDFVAAEVDAGVFRRVIANRLAAPAPEPQPQEEDMRFYKAVAVPAPDTSGKQLVAVPELAFDKVTSATIKANNDGTPVLATVQVCEYATKLVLSFVGLNGKPTTPGMVGVVLGVRP